MIDAATANDDATMLSIDATVPAVDASVPHADAATAHVDAAVRVVDASVTHADAAAVHIDATSSAADAQLAIDSALAIVDARATPDAAVLPDAGSGAVAVTVYDNQHAAAVGASVIFEDLDGTLTTVTTDEAGTASAAVQAGGAVTVIQDEGYHQIDSILGVEPGDALTFGTAPDTSPSRNTVAISVTPPEFDTLLYQLTVNSTCGIGQNFGAGTTFPALMSVYDDCAGELVFTLSYADATIGTAGDNFEYFEVPAQLYAEGDQVAPDGPWLVAPATTVRFDSVPDGAVLQYLYVAAIVTATNAAAANDVFAVALPVEATLVASGHLPPVGDATFMQTSFFDGDNGTQTIQSTSTTLFSQPIDSTTLLLPWIDDFASYDSSTRVLSWSQTDGASVDGDFFLMVYNATDDNEVVWNILAPPSAGLLHVPHLPASLSALEPPTFADTDASAIALPFATQPSTPYSIVRGVPNVTQQSLPAPGFVGTYVLSQVNVQ